MVQGEKLGYGEEGGQTEKQRIALSQEVERPFKRLERSVREVCRDGRLEGGKSIGIMSVPDKRPK